MSSNNTNNSFLYLFKVYQAEDSFASFTQDLQKEGQKSVTDDEISGSFVRRT